MNVETMRLCADLILSTAIQDAAKREHRDIASVRRELICSGAYEALYDFETDLWQEGPDYFYYFYQTLEKNHAKKRLNKTI